ncbi:MAG: DUF3857 domain-containing protein [Terracidiphilus sp.]
MRIFAFKRNLSLLLVLTSPLLLRAQFQEPTPEELKMTSDPKAPGAAAVFLNVEEVSNDLLHYQTFYARIKVLTEKGKELATVEVPPVLRGESKIVDIKGRTIHSDGTVVALTGKPEELLLFKTKDRNGDATQVSRKVFTLPSVEVGSILEYSYQIQDDEQYSSSPHWEIQQEYFVHKAHYSFTPFPNFMPGANILRATTSRYLEDEHERVINSLVWFWHLPNGVAVKSYPDHYSVDVADVPPIPDEEWMPPVDTVRHRVFFYYKAASSAADFWVTDAKLWSKDVDRFAEPSKALKEMVAGLVAPADSELDKAKKLYQAVQALDNTDYTRKKSESELKQLKLKQVKRAEDVWNQKAGDSEEVAMLYLAMLRAAGLSAYALKVVDRLQGAFDDNYLSLSQFNRTLVILVTGGKDYILDPGEKMCPFLAISWRHSGAGGIRQSTSNNYLVSTHEQSYPDNKTVRIGDVVLDGQGGMTGSFRIVMSGQEALYWRQKAITDDDAEVKKQFDKGLELIFPEGVEAHVDSFTGMNDPEVNLIAFVKAKGALGAATAKRLMLPAFFFETHGGHPFVAQEKRLTPVDMHFGETVLDQVTYHLPEGFTLEGAPQDAKLSWPQHAIFNASSVSAPGQITVSRKLYRAFTFAKPDEYQDLRGFYQKIAAADQAELVLARVQTEKGN